MKFSLIAAADDKMGIGKNDTLPWHVPTDLKYFHDTTTGGGKNAVIMGRTTWESLPEKFRPLKGRFNIVLSRRGAVELPTSDEVFNGQRVGASSLAEAISLAESKKSHEIFVIGGAQLFREAIAHPDCALIYLTRISGDFGCDVFFPDPEEFGFKKIADADPVEKNGITFRFQKFAKIQARDS